MSKLLLSKKKGNDFGLFSQTRPTLPNVYSSLTSVERVRNSRHTREGEAKVKFIVGMVEIPISDDFYQRILIGKEKVMATLQPEKFDVFCWLKGYFPSDEINKDDIPDVLNFSLMWNLFESKVCEDVSYREPFAVKMEHFVKKLPSMNSLVNENYNRPLRYFQERYTDEGEVNCKFHDLKFKNSDKKLLVQSVLEGKDNKPSSVLLALLIIIYRLRCNFFHGVKPIRELKEQDINFKVANIFLSKILAAEENNLYG